MWRNWVNVAIRWLRCVFTLTKYEDNGLIACSLNLIVSGWLHVKVTFGGGSCCKFRYVLGRIYVGISQQLQCCNWSSESYRLSEGIKFCRVLHQYVARSHHIACYYHGRQAERIEAFEKQEIRQITAHACILNLELNRHLVMKIFQLTASLHKHPWVFQKDWTVIQFLDCLTQSYWNLLLKYCLGRRTNVGQQICNIPIGLLFHRSMELILNRTSI